MLVKLLGTSVNSNTTSTVTGADLTFGQFVVGKRYKIGTLGTSNAAAWRFVGAATGTTVNEVFIATQTGISTGQAAGSGESGGTSGLAKIMSDPNSGRTNVSNAKCVLVTNGSDGKRFINVTTADGTLVGSVQVPRYGMIKLQKDPDQMLWAASNGTGLGTNEPLVQFSPIAFTD